MTVLSPALEQAILGSVRRGTPPAIAFTRNGVSAETFRRWRTIAETDATTWPGTTSLVQTETKEGICRFVEEIARAEAECFSILTDSLFENATKANEKTGWYDTQAADRMLSKHAGFRKHWHEERHVVQEGAIQHNHVMQRLEQLPDDELFALADAEPTLPDPTNVPA